MFLLNLLAWADPVRRSPVRPGPAPSSFSWTPTHTWIAGGAGVLLLFFLFVLACVALFVFLRKRGASKPTAPIRRPNAPQLMTGFADAPPGVVQAALEDLKRLDAEQKDAEQKVMSEWTRRRRFRPTADQ